MFSSAFSNPFLFDFTPPKNMNKKHLTKKQTPKIKKQSFKQIVDKLRDYIDEGRPPFWETTAEQLPGCCGMAVVSELETSQNRLDQAGHILAAFEGSSGEAGKVSQVIFTDIVRSKKWKEAKEFAIRGPITKNPKSSNTIQMYIYTQAEFAELIASFTPQDLEVLFEENTDQDDND